MDDKKRHFPSDLGDNGQATVLRGFAQQIQQLQLPRINVVKKIGKDIGLVIMTQAQFDNLAPTNVQIIKNPIKTILCSQMSDKDKLLKIAELVK